MVSPSAASPPTWTTVHGASAGMSSPGASLARWPASQSTTLAWLPSSRIAMAGGANAVNSGTSTAPARQMPSTATA